MTWPHPAGLAAPRWPGRTPLAWPHPAGLAAPRWPGCPAGLAAPLAWLPLRGAAGCLGRYHGRMSSFLSQVMMPR
jgi:hypothetical protein